MILSERCPSLQWGGLQYYAPWGLTPYCYGQEYNYYPNSPQSDSESSTLSVDYHMKEASPPESPKRLFKPYEDLTPSSQEDFCCRWKSCTASFGALDALSSHVSAAHSDAVGGLFYCGWEGCPRGHKGFNARYKMLVHVRTHTNEKPHRCAQCEKSFSRAENLKIHMRSHSGEKPYVCPVEGCNKAYSNSSDRFKHTRTHSVDRPYFCKIAGCHKRYTDPSSLRKHVKTFKHAAPCPTSQTSKYNTIKEQILRRCDPNRANSESDVYERVSPYSDSERLEVEEPLDLGKKNYIFENGVLNLDTKALSVDAPLDLSISRNYL